MSVEPSSATRVASLSGFPRGVGIALLVVASLAGCVAGVGLTVTTGTTTANGNYESATSLAWWSFQTSATTTIPTSVPSAASTTVASPTILPSTGTLAFVINAATAGHNAIRWDFTLATTAPTSTEVEITFTAGTGVGSTTTIKIYVETQTSIPSPAKTYSFYFDAGTTLASNFVIQTFDETSQRCAAVGSCP